MYELQDRHGAEIGNLTKLLVRQKVSKVWENMPDSVENEITFQEFSEYLRDLLRQ